MLYKFKSKAAGDLIMLEPNGRQILRILGKDDTDSLTKGILLPSDIPAALMALEHAIREEDELLQQRVREAVAQDRDPPHPDGISLRQRAAPFVEMLKRCLKEDKELVWGV
ncbi:MAG: DUF1840 domain-containing protein [Candidatus Methylumidiphilus sp.]